MLHGSTAHITRQPNPAVQYTNYSTGLSVCIDNTALEGVYSTQVCLVLYLFLDMPPRAVFSLKTCGSALSITMFPSKSYKALNVMVCMVIAINFIVCMLLLICPLDHFLYLQLHSCPFLVVLGLLDSLLLMNILSSLHGYLPS